MIDEIHAAVKVLKWATSILRRHKDRKEYLEAHIPAGFLEDYAREILCGVKLTNGHFADLYVPLKFTPQLVADSEEGKEEPQDMTGYLLGRFKDKRSEQGKRFIILGDTGMGKTAALVYLFIKYVLGGRGNDELRILEMREMKLLTRNDGSGQKYIGSIDEVKKELGKKVARCILLLDGLDECPAAQESLRDFMSVLNRDTNEFDFVVITSRTQFFESPNDVPDSAERRRKNGTEKYEKLYVAKFDYGQIEEYLNRRYETGNEKRRRAEEIVNECPKEMSRPLILTYMDYLLEAIGKMNATLSIYDEIVYQWLRREASILSETADDEELDAKAAEMWEQSLRMAVKMYESHTDRVSVGEYCGLFKEALGEAEAGSAEAVQFRRNSLLTREGSDVCFAHRAFYEYFLAYAFILGECYPGNVAGLDTAITLFDQLAEYGLSSAGVGGYHYAERVRLVREGGLAAALFSMGKALQDLNRFAVAEKQYNKALEIFRTLAAANPEAYRPAVAQTLNNLANLHSALGRHAEAEHEYSEALETYRALAEANPEAYRPAVAQTLNNLANLHEALGRHAEAEQKCAEALKILRALAAASPEAYRPDVAMTLNNLAILHKVLGRHDEAEQEYAEALEKYRALAAATPEAYRPDVAMTLNNLANLHSDLGRHAEAEQEYAEALEIRRALAAATPEAYRPNVATTLNNLANLHSDLGRHAEAEQEYAEALEIRRALAAATPEAYRPDVAMTLYNYSLLRETQGRRDEAIDLAREALEIYEAENVRTGIYAKEVEDCRQQLRDLGAEP